jgi:biotin synthase-related radical SAM superfamily protein
MWGGSARISISICRTIFESNLLKRVRSMKGIQRISSARGMNASYLKMIRTIERTTGEEYRWKRVVDVVILFAC